MITDTILNAILLPIVYLLNLLPVINMNYDNSVFAQLFNYLKMWNEIVPVDTALACLGLIYSIKLFSIAWTLVLKLKSFIPTMGD